MHWLFLANVFLFLFGAGIIGDQLFGSAVSMHPVQSIFMVAVVFGSALFSLATFTSLVRGEKKSEEQMRGATIVTVVLWVTFAIVMYWYITPIISL